MLNLQDWIACVAELFKNDLIALYIASNSGSVGYLPHSEKSCGPVEPQSYDQQQFETLLRENGTTFDFKQYTFENFDQIALLKSESDYLLLKLNSDQQYVLGLVCDEQQMEKAKQIVDACAELLKE